MRKQGRAEGGQALVEFALLLPLLVLLVFGIIEFGQVFVSYLNVAQVAHEAAREASLGGSAAQATAAAQAAATATGLDAANLTVNISGTTYQGGWQTGTPVSAAVSYPVPVTVAVFWPILGQTFTVKSTVSMLEEAGNPAG